MYKVTTKPKGATSYKETVFGIIPRTRLLRFELEGTKRGLQYLHDIVQKRVIIALSPKLICKIHKVSFGWIFPRWAGKYRTIQVTYSGKEAPLYFQVPELVMNLCRDTEERLRHLPSRDAETFITDVIGFLTWFQHRFVFIHPFQDYNGRTARMLTTLLLLRLHLPPIELKAETGIDRRRYLTAMQRADDSDYTLLEDLISHALSETMERILKRKPKP